ARGSADRRVYRAESGGTWRRRRACGTASRASGHERGVCAHGTANPKAAHSTGVVGTSGRMQLMSADSAGTRRDFLKRAATGAAGLAVLPNVRLNGLGKSLTPLP